jgi:predicted metal-binding membrane protein
MTRKQPATPRKRPRQARSRETYTAILEATARILEAEGLEAANTNAIAARAGASVGAVGGPSSFSLPFGLAFARLVAELAKRVATLGILAAGAFAVIIATSLYAMRDYVVRAYTAEEEIARTASGLFGPLGLLIMLQAVS